MSGNVIPGGPPPTAVDASLALVDVNEIPPFPTITVPITIQQDRVFIASSSTSSLPEAFEVKEQLMSLNPYHALRPC